MRLKNITAKAHPTGNRIDLKWENPDRHEYPGVRIIRRERTYTGTPEDCFLEVGDLVVEGNELPFCLDLSFQSELDNQILSEALRQEFSDSNIPLSENAIVTIEVLGSEWQIIDGEQIYLVRKIPKDCFLVKDVEDVEEDDESAVDNNLKGETVYYYALFPYKHVNGEPEYQVDSRNRVAAMATSPHSMAGQMYDLLPAIYRRYDTIVPEDDVEGIPDEDRQKGQLRRFLDLPGSQLDQFYSFARAMLELHNVHSVDGSLLPLLAQWIGWDTDYTLELTAQRNEIRNAPGLYRTLGVIPAVEVTIKRLLGWECRTKEFAHNIIISNRPERLNIWTCNTGEWSPLSLDFAYEGRPTVVHEGDTIWLYYHTLKQRYDPEEKKWGKEWDISNIYYKTYSESSESQGWSASQPVTKGKRIDKRPTAVLQGGTLWVFWSTYSETECMWRINYCTRTDEVWSPIQGFSDGGTERKNPWAVVDDMGGLWLFWTERVGEGWQLKYNRHDGNAWELPEAATFPEEYIPVENDLFVLFHTTDATIWVFWAGKEAAGEPWTIFYRVKESIDPNVVSDWGEIQTLPKDALECDDREPAAIVNGSEIELFWSSNRDGSWSIWRKTLDIEPDDSGIVEPFASNPNPYSQRVPLPVSMNDGTWVIYRSNESLSYTSEVYGATETLDSRYAGCTTVDTRNLAKIALRQKFEDFQTYTIDVGQNGKRTDRDWYAPDTAGIYLTAENEEQALIISNYKKIENALRKFLPIQIRTVFIIVPMAYIDTYDFPIDNEQFFDQAFFTSAEMYTGLGESYEDTAPDWIWFRSWCCDPTPDFPLPPTALTVLIEDSTVYNAEFRTWHIALKAGG